jgi:hypothetical protein
MQLQPTLKMYARHELERARPASAEHASAYFTCALTRAAAVPSSAALLLQNH